MKFTNISLKCLQFLWEQMLLGLVEESKNGQLVVKFMARSGNKFYWPKTNDVQIVAENDILCKINFAPKPISTSRPNIYFLQEFQDINDLFLGH